jgi:hypothetical protein
MVLNKFDVAERQLLQAISLFFQRGDPVSVHTISEAAAQVLYDIRGHLGVESQIRDSDLIRTEYKKEWLAALGKSRNFFKHADRDPADSHEFKEEFNHFSLLDGIGMYGPAKGAWTPETIIYFGWFATIYPDLVRPDERLSAALQIYRTEMRGNPERLMTLCAEAIEQMRSGKLTFPGVSLSWGRGSAV